MNGGDDMEKRFNTTGTCFPAMHYMVDISEGLAAIIIRTLPISNSNVFSINDLTK